MRVRVLRGGGSAARVRVLSCHGSLSSVCGVVAQGGALPGRRPVGKS